MSDEKSVPVQKQSPKGKDIQKVKSYEYSFPGFMSESEIAYFRTLDPRARLIYAIVTCQNLALKIQSLELTDVKSKEIQSINLMRKTFGEFSDSKKVNVKNLLTMLKEVCKTLRFKKKELVNTNVVRGSFQVTWNPPKLEHMPVISDSEVRESGSISYGKTVEILGKLFGAQLLEDGELVLLGDYAAVSQLLYDAAWLSQSEKECKRRVDEFVAFAVENKSDKNSYGDRFIIRNDNDTTGKCWIILVKSENGEQDTVKRLHVDLDLGFFKKRCLTCKGPGIYMCLACERRVPVELSYEEHQAPLFCGVMCESMASDRHVLGCERYIYSLWNEFYTQTLCFFRRREINGMSRDLRDISRVMKTEDRLLKFLPVFNVALKENDYEKLRIQAESDKKIREMKEETKRVIEEKIKKLESGLDSLIVQDNEKEEKEKKEKSPDFKEPVLPSRTEEKLPFEVPLMPGGVPQNEQDAKEVKQMLKEKEQEHHDKASWKKAIVQALLEFQDFAKQPVVLKEVKMNRHYKSRFQLFMEEELGFQFRPMTDIRFAQMMTHLPGKSMETQLALESLYKLYQKSLPPIFKCPEQVAYEKLHRKTLPPMSEVDFEEHLYRSAETQEEKYLLRPWENPKNSYWKKKATERLHRNSISKS